MERGKEGGETERQREGITAIRRGHVYGCVSAGGGWCHVGCLLLRRSASPRVIASLCRVTMSTPTQKHIFSQASVCWYLHSS